MNTDKPKEAPVGLMILVAIVVAVVMTAIMGGFRGGSGYSAPSGGPSRGQGNTYPITEHQQDIMIETAKQWGHNDAKLRDFNERHGLNNGGK